jgi:hypothetical protein
MPVMPAKSADLEYEANDSFTWDDPDTGVHFYYDTGDDWQGTAEQAEPLLTPVDNENGKRPALLRVKSPRSPRKEN